MPNRWILAALLLAAAPLPAAENDLAAQLQAVQAKLEQLSQRVEDQQKIIEKQQQQIHDQQNVLTTMTAQRPISNSMDKVLERLDVAEKQSADAIKIASRKKPNDLNMSIGAAIDTSFRAYDGSSSHTDRPAGATSPCVAPSWSVTPMLIRSSRRTWC